MKRFPVTRLILLASIFLPLIGACSGQSPTQSISADPVPLENAPQQQDINTLELPADVPNPAPDAAAISGLVYSYTVSRVLPGTLFYLTPALGENKDLVPSLLIGPVEENGDITGTTDELGQINLKDIPPGNYYIILWAPYNWPIVEISPTEQTPRLIELKEGDQQALGILFASWP